ncbi:MAG: hypothetical protein WC516_05605 [Patescibacteria group bacterium]
MKIKYKRPEDVCSICGNFKPIITRDATGSPICSKCYMKNYTARRKMFYLWNSTTY